MGFGWKQKIVDLQTRPWDEKTLWSRGKQKKLVGIRIGSGSSLVTKDKEDTSIWGAFVFSEVQLGPFYCMWSGLT